MIDIFFGTKCLHMRIYLLEETKTRHIQQKMKTQKREDSYFGQN